jgi:hypothetical protein
VSDFNNLKNPKNPKNLTNMENAGLVAAWIMGLILAGWLLFFLTRHIQTNTLARAVNKTLAQTEEVRRLELEPLGGNSLGTWFPVVGAEESGGGDRALLFSIIDNGIFAPCVAFVLNDGAIEILPLNNHAKAVFPRIPGGVIDMYRKRIEQEAAR